MKYNPVLDVNGQKWIVKTHTVKGQAMGHTFENKEEAFDFAAALTAQYHMRKAREAILALQVETPHFYDVGQELVLTEEKLQDKYELRSDFDSSDPCAWKC